MDNVQILETAKKKETQLITLCMGYMTAIYYFEDVRLHNELDNSVLIELCKEDLKGIKNGSIKTRPYNIQDEIVLGRIYDADENELLSLFEKKFEEAKQIDGFKTKKSFAKYEYKYQRGIWKNHDITKLIPIAKQWINLLKEIKEAEPEKVENKKGAGNKTAERLPADQLIIKDWTPQTKTRFINCLKNEFSNTKYKPKDINNVISYLTVNEYIDNSKDNIVIKEAFCIALKNDKKYQTTANFNKQYHTTEMDYYNFYGKGKENAIPEKINNLVETNNIS